eukprot:7093334-Prymnesium_polylepis.1
MSASVSSSASCTSRTVSGGERAALRCREQLVCANDLSPEERRYPPRPVNESSAGPRDRAARSEARGDSSELSIDERRHE